MKFMQHKIDHGEDKKTDYIQDKQRLNNFCTQNILLPHRYSVFILNCMTNIGIVKLIGMEKLMDIYLQLISHRLQIHDEIQRIIESKMDRKNLICPISSNTTFSHNNNSNNHNEDSNNINNININSMDTENPSLSNPYFLCQTMMTQPDPFKQELLENENKEIKNEEEQEQEQEQQQNFENENDNNDKRTASESPLSISSNINIKTEIDMEMKHEQQEQQQEKRKKFTMPINKTRKIKKKKYNKALSCTQEQVVMINEANKENIINISNMHNSTINSNHVCSKNVNQSLSDDEEQPNCNVNRKRSHIDSNSIEPSSKRRKLN